MKNVPANAPAPAPTQAEHHLLRFWISFAVSLFALGVISALMLSGLFLLMGYHIF